jgi:outer membrane protein OmpA-like peptidoglycan-associated protein
MANASNLFYGHYTDRRFNIIPFVGVGLINAYDNKTTTPDFWYVAFKAGVHIDCKITSGLSIYIEPKAYATNDEFDGYRGTAFADALTNLSLGLKYTFNKGFADIGRLTLLEIDRLNDRINENRQRLDEHQDILDRHEQQIRDLYDRIEKCCEEKPVIVVDKPADTDALPLDIFFKIDSYKIQPQEQYKIDKIVEFLNTKKGAKVLLVGYADVKTAYPKYNMTLSKKRVDAVAAQLKAKGVPANRISLDWKGDTVQPFEINEMNRCVIAIEQR